ncbi:hypothetical protein EJV47_03890 [Hymenobacter gummosus]|uniref:Uncharacterized protein n=1 Tax=Hymenobacter gummosus TaxID=1776032 RepID=A0A3S0K7G5_9BACT|nr:hypothetical protein [Hymenobacter gummosus]RTQ52176.1 hypothetical protein EJV47_03890 [Hymenobacter gummosus]
MNQHPNRRPDEYDDRNRNQPNRHDDRRPHDRFGDNYEPRRNWREPDRDERRQFDSPWDQPHRGPADERRRQQEDDDRRRGFSNYGDYGGSERGRGYGPGRPGSGGADYARGNDDRRRSDDEPGFRPNATSGFIRDEQQRRGNYTQRDYDNPRRRGYDDARNLPRGDFDRSSSDRRPADRFYENYRDDFTRRPERRDDNDSGRQGRREADHNEPRRRYDGSNRDGARSDYGYGDDYSSSLYDPNSRNSAFRRHDEDSDRSARRPQSDRGRRWSDTPDLDNQPRR